MEEKTVIPEITDGCPHGLTGDSDPWTNEKMLAQVTSGD